MTNHPSWDSFLTDNVLDIIDNIKEKIYKCDYYPREKYVLRFLDADLNNVKYIIMGMEPYPSFNSFDGIPQATGRSFEASEIIGKDWNYKIKQSSLRNILKAIYFNETGIKASMEEIREEINSGKFVVANPGDWFDKMEEQGVLFLNSTLTVEAGKVGSHKKLWEPFRGELIPFLGKRDIKWMLWGNNAKEEVGQYLDDSKILTAPHPRLDSFVKQNTFQFAKDINWKGV